MASSASHPIFGSTQPDNRRAYDVKDQFGRPWFVVTENKTGQITGIPMTLGWSDPIHTPQHYVRMDPADPNRLIVHYEEWAADLRSAQEIWQRRLQEEGFSRYGEKFDPDDEHQPPYLLRITGPKPFDPDIVELAALGEAKYLGMEPEARPEDEILELRKRVALLEKEKRDDAIRAPLVKQKKKE